MRLALTVCTISSSKDCVHCIDHNEEMIYNEEVNQDDRNCQDVESKWKDAIIFWGHVMYSEVTMAVRPPGPFLILPSGPPRIV